MGIFRRLFLVASSLVLLPTSGIAQNYPSKLVTLVVPYTPGSQSDVMGRAVAQRLSERWGQPVIIENKPGAATTLGAAQVARAAPDGYTLLLAPPPFVITQHLYPKLSYDSRKDFEPISLIAYYPLVMTVPANSPVKSLKDLVVAMRAKPGATYGSPGTGTTPHLIGELLAQHEKLDMIHVPYKGGGQAVIDLIADRLTFYAGAPAEVVPQIRGGTLRAIAVLGPTRSDQLPGIPTSTEEGMAYLQAQSWNAIVAPAGTPKAIIEKISSDIAAVVALPELRDPLTAQGAIFVGSTPGKLKSFLDGEHEKYGPLIKSIGLKPDQ